MCEPMFRYYMFSLGRNNVISPRHGNALYVQSHESLRDTLVIQNPLLHVAPVLCNHRCLSIKHLHDQHVPRDHQLKLLYLCTENYRMSIVQDVFAECFLARSRDGFSEEEIVC